MGLIYRQLIRIGPNLTVNVSRRGVSNSGHAGPLTASTRGSRMTAEYANVERGIRRLVEEVVRFEGLALGDLDANVADYQAATGAARAAISLREDHRWGYGS